MQTLTSNHRGALSVTKSDLIPLLAVSLFSYCPDYMIFHPSFLPCDKFLAQPPVVLVGVQLHFLHHCLWQCHLPCESLSRTCMFHKATTCTCVHESSQVRRLSLTTHDLLWCNTRTSEPIIGIVHFIYNFRLSFFFSPLLWYLVWFSRLHMQSTLRSHL